MSLRMGVWIFIALTQRVRFIQAVQRRELQSANLSIWRLMRRYSQYHQIPRLDSASDTGTIGAARTGCASERVLQLSGRIWTHSMQASVRSDKALNAAVCAVPFVDPQRERPRT